MTPSLSIHPIMAPTYPMATHLIIFFLLLLISIPISISTPTPTPTPWPPQFHSILFVNYSGSLSLIDLWYDWPNGRNFNIIQDQLGGPPLYDLEWNNGTSFVYTLSSPLKCRTAQLEVGILRPNWLDGATYLGQETVDGFLCNVWEKVDFIWYYEDVATNRPVHWVFYTGRSAHVMTFEVGAALKDEKWQAPVYCFDHKGEDEEEHTNPIPNPIIYEQIQHKNKERDLICCSSEVYVVYMGRQNGEDPDEIMKQNHQILTSLHGGSIEKAKESHVYSYSNGFKGFAAKLTEEQASMLAEMPNVVSVFRNEKRSLHTTHSWDFLGLRIDEAMEILEIFLLNPLYRV